MEKQLKLNEKLDLILKNLNDEQVNKNIDTLMEMFLQKRLILTKIDLLKVFGIKLTTFNELQQAITRKETSRVEIQKIQQIMNKQLFSEKFSLDILHFKILESNTYYYLL